MTAFWHEGDTVTLYHGTSSALLPAIERDGLKPPPLDLDGYAWEIARTYLGRDPDPDLWAQIRQTAVTPREHAGRFSRTAGTARIFTHPYPCFDQAAGYARSFCEHGGEVAYCVWQRLRAHVSPALLPRFQGSDPVVLELEAPREAVLSNHDLADLTQRVLAVWEDEKSEFASFEAFVADLGGFEMSLDRPLPPEAISAVHPVTEPELEASVSMLGPT